MSPRARARREIPEWARGDPLMEQYATEVFGRRTDDEDELFEVMCLQLFQAGLTWRMILARRGAFRKAFKGWQIEKVARITPRGVERLLADASIVRNRKKIEACIANARVVRDIQGEHGSFCRWFYDVLDGDDLPALQQQLRSRFRFMGPEIARMWLISAGRVPEGTH